MGVKDLWHVIAPVCERKSLWELEGRPVAVDLSAWVCDSQNVADHSSQPNMHLRNLFFRTSCLLLLGARPVFVLEGTAPDLKLDVISQRREARGLLPNKSTKRTGSRTTLKSIQKQCQEMLRFMGVPCVKSFGEAEALCALLNEKGLVDGCVTQDSDCLLYGARVIYRNFTISSSGASGGPSFSVDVYKMERIENELGLTRNKLIGLSLLCGCDYNQAGVSGVGKESAVKFISSLKDSEVFSRLQSWRYDEKFDQFEKERMLGLCKRCGHYGKQREHDRNGCMDCGSKKKCSENVVVEALSQKDPENFKEIVNELNIRKKALQDPNFPSQDIINEYLHPREVSLKDFSCEWFQPNMIEFMKFAERKLKWEESYSFEKFFPILTRWVLLLKHNSLSKCPIFPKAILKRRVLKGVASYEVEWKDNAGLFETIKGETDSVNLCVTVEPQELFERAFPQLTQAFKDSENAKKEAKRKGMKKPKSRKNLSKCDTCGKTMPEKKQKCICKFFDSTASCHKKEKTLEDMLNNLILTRNHNANQDREAMEFSSNSSSFRGDKIDEFKTGTKSQMPLYDGVISPVNDESDLHSPNQQDLYSSGVVCNEKCSFEFLLSGETCFPSDLVSIKELDLSEIVESIAGQGFPCSDEDMRGKMFVKTDHGNQDTGIASCSETASAMCSPKENSTNSSSDEEVPYTPLIERIRLKGATYNRRTSVLPTCLTNRFSESFDFFCEEMQSVSSPNERPNFSLGISDILQISES